MGFEDRDYARDGSYSRFGSGEALLASSPACKWLIIITVVVYVSQIFALRPPTENEVRGFVGQYESFEPDGKSFRRFAASYPRVSVTEQWLELDRRKVSRGQVWRLLTSAFCHNRFGIWHIAFNMFLLYWFGRALESIYGSKEFLLFYLSSAIFASTIYCALQMVTGETVSAIGASGAVMGVMCLYTMWYPRDTIRVMMLVPVEMRVLLLLYVLYDLHPVLMQLAGSPMPTGIGHAAHLGGLAFGFVYWRQSWRLAPIWNWVEQRFGKKKKFNLKRNRATHDGPATKPFPNSKPVDKRFESQLDSVLEKISREGESSLTDHERKVLERASERYREG